MLVVSNMAAERHLTQPIGGGGIPAPIGQVQNNAPCVATIPAPPAGMRTHLLAVYCGYSGALAGVAALVGLPGLPAQNVNGITDQTIELGSPFTTVAYTITLNAGGVGVLGFLVCIYEFVG